MLLSTGLSFHLQHDYNHCKTTSNVEFFAVDSLQKLKHTVGTSPFFARVRRRILRFAACLNPYATLHLTAL